MLKPWPLIGSTLVSIILAIPGVTFFGALLVFPLFIFLWLAVCANFLPFLMFGLRVFAHNSTRQFSLKLFETWAYCTIMWVGCAYGISRMGDIASSMGADNSPYHMVFFGPWIVLKEVTVGGGNAL